MVNDMFATYAQSPGFCILKTNVEAQKIDRLTLKTHKIFIAVFSLKYKLRQVGFFEEIFLLTEISIEVIQEMSFFYLAIQMYNL